MVANLRLESVKLVTVLLVLAGVGAAIGVVTVPGDVLNGAVARSQLADVLPAAATPIGVTGRVLLAIAVGAFVASLGFLPFAATIRSIRLPALRMPLRSARTIRRADAHPDAPPRRPIRASEDLGQPLPICGQLAVPPQPIRERALPADLDTPMAAFDPDALPDVPREPVRAVAPLARPALIDPGERFETFELTPVTRTAVERTTQQGEGATLSSLVERLERVTIARRKPVADPVPATHLYAGLDDTLAQLRRLATG